jgi:hypothetical protein
MRIPPSLKITFKKTFNIPMYAAPAQLFHRHTAGVKGKFDRAGVGI